MPRVKEQKKSKRGTRICGREGCGIEIKPGETYYWWSFRYGGRQVRCSAHFPKQSELTQSKMSGVYASVESAVEQLETMDLTIEDITNLVHEVGEAAQEVVGEYREAAENFGGAGENAERADELEGWAGELEGFEPDVPEEEEFDEEAHDEEAKDRSEELDVSFASALQVIREEWEAEHEEEIETNIENAKTEAQELLSSCPI